MVVNKLLDLGFSENEAKAYLSLLEEYPVTAYETAKKSNIPTSKIYGVLNKLLSKGIILEVNENQKKKYIPKEPEKFIEGYRSKMDNLLFDLKDDLNNITKKTGVSFISNISDYKYFMKKACEIVSEAKETLLISLWAEELSEIKAFLPDKNIKTAIVHFGKTDFKFEKIFIHPIEDTIYDEKKGRGFVIVKDSKEVLIGTIDNDKNIEGAYSANKAFITMAEDYIKHDIYIMKIVSRFNDLLIEKFGDNYKELRDIFNDKSF